jgi:ankyrin repeat protein
MRLKSLLILAALPVALAGAAQAGEIHDAVQAGDVARVRAQVAADSAVLLTLDDSRRTPLHWAVLDEREPALWALVYTPQALELFDFMGATPLHLAVMNTTSTEPLAGLLARGAKVDLATRLAKETPLHWAAEQGNLRALEVLLGSGADLRARQLAGATPLHLAAPGAAAIRRSCASSSTTAPRSTPRTPCA